MESQQSQNNNSKPSQAKKSDPTQKKLSLNPLQAATKEPSTNPLQAATKEPSTNPLQAATKEPSTNPLQAATKEPSTNPLQAQKGSNSAQNGLPAQLMPGEILNKAENVLGEDLSNVKISESEKASDIGALAYTQGNEITFAPGQFKPQTQSGQALIGHELTHVKQQRQGRVQANTQTKGLPVNDEPALENEADQLGSQIAQAKSDSTPLQTKTIQQKGTSQAQVAQLDTPRTVTLPEQLGSREQGPIAVRGRGDAHAFSPNDINQGSIGDCYFLASLAAVANTNPNLLQNAITENSDGTYTVRLYQKTESRFLFWTRQVFNPILITLYPTFPISAAGHDAANPNASANPPHAQGGDQNVSGQVELWVRLFEKAYAILLGSYRAIGNGGLGGNALEALTGQPYREEVLGNDTKRRIIQMVGDGIPVEVATFRDSWNTMSNEMKTFAQDNSIVPGHSYAVMAADQSSITVRNPWGTGARNATPTLTWAQFSAMFWQFSNRL